MINPGIENIEVLLMLLLAHILGDFVFQNSAWVEDKYENKYRSKALYMHGLTHAILATTAWVLLLGWSLDLIWVVGIIAISHCLIDLFKAYTNKSSVLWFLVDQALHVMVIVGVWIWFTNQPQKLEPLLSWLLACQTIGILLAYLVVLKPVSVLVGLICKTWADGGADTNSLPNAGTLIGYLERVLILTFILIDQFGAIGFLLAAKSIMRFGSASGSNHRKLTEYVIVGTLSSFTIAIFIGLAVKWSVC
ncbi:MAG: DUF3307 domain-containing protein [Xanthomonadales bacterium]|nr:DUF3307 domain-containing protein [Xanthomonadales bacterium]